MDSKPLLYSWSFWFGLLQILLGGVGFLSGKMGQAEALGLLGLGVTNIGLRAKTTQPIGSIFPEK